MNDYLIDEELVEWVDQFIQHWTSSNYENVLLHQLSCKQKDQNHKGRWKIIMRYEEIIHSRVLKIITSLQQSNQEETIS